MTSLSCLLRNHRKTESGSTIAETAASLCLLLPLLVTILFVVLEVSHAYLIKEALANAGRQAARDLAVAYGQNPKVESDKQMQQAILDQIRITGIVEASEQFDDPQWNSSGSPPTVKVTVRYLSGQYGLAVFPNPDPLQLGSNFRIDSSATYRLE